MFKWFKRVFTSAAPFAIGAAVAVAKAELNRKLNHTDKLDSIHKVVVRGMIDEFVADLLAAARK